MRANYMVMLLGIFLSIMFAMPSASAETKTFSATGEYTMSDYETPAVAEQRAIAYAEQRAAEQAGVYVETYTRMEKMQVTEDTVNAITNSALKVTGQRTSKKALPSGDVHIIAEITAEVDTIDIERLLRDNADKREQMALQYKELQQSIARQERENDELKQKISELKAKNLPTQDSQIEAKVKEREFLAEQKIKEANMRYGQGDYSLTIALCKEALALNPKSTSAYVGIGMALARLQRYDDSIKSLNNALALAADNAWALFIRGNVYRDKGETDKAFADYNQAIDISPENNASLYYNRGTLYLDKGELEKAIVDYTRALTIEPLAADAYNNRGLSYLDKGEFDKAIADFNRALDINPKNDSAYNNRGNTYSDKGEYAKAIADYNHALAINPENAEAYNNRGNAYGRKGEYEKAISDYNRALILDPQYAGAYDNRGNTYRLKGKYDQAIADFDKALENDPRDARAYLLRGLTYIAKTEYGKAIADLGKAIAINPKLTEAYLARGYIYGASGDYDKAIADFKQVLALDPNNQDARAKLQLAYEYKERQR